MPPELMELYNLYQMEIETRENNEKDQNLLVEAEKILRVIGPPNLRARNKSIEMILRVNKTQCLLAMCTSRKKFQATNVQAQGIMSSLFQTPSMVSLRPELEEDDNVAYGSDDHKLPPIVREQQ